MMSDNIVAAQAKSALEEAASPAPKASSAEEEEHGASEESLLLDSSCPRCHCGPPSHRGFRIQGAAQRRQQPLPLLRLQSLSLPRIGHCLQNSDLRRRQRLRREHNRFRRRYFSGRTPQKRRDRLLNV